jgi:hypothetical protein
VCAAPAALLALAGTAGSIGASRHHWPMLACCCCGWRCVPGEKCAARMVPTRVARTTSGQAEPAGFRGGRGSQEEAACGRTGGEGTAHGAGAALLDVLLDPVVRGLVRHVAGGLLGRSGAALRCCDDPDVPTHCGAWPNAGLVPPPQAPGALNKAPSGSTNSHGSSRRPRPSEPPRSTQLRHVQKLSTPSLERCQATHLVFWVAVRPRGQWLLLEILRGSRGSTGRAGARCGEATEVVEALGAAGVEKNA